MCDVSETENKKERFGVSMDSQILAGADAVAAEDFGGNRSAYLEEVVAKDLSTRGRPVKLKLAEMAVAAARIVGEEAVAEALRGLGQGEMQLAANGGA